MSEPPTDMPDPLPVEDHELEQWLQDAYAAPPLPPSILRRLHTELSHEGQAAILPQALSPVSSPKSLWTRQTLRWFAAASVLAVVTLTFFWRGESRSAWAAMVDALERRGIVQLTSPHAERWLALKDGLLGERTADSMRLVDLHRQIVLERTSTSSGLRQSFWKTSAVTSDRDRLVLGFLVGTATTIQHPDLKLTRWEMESAADSSASERFSCVWEDGTEAPVELLLGLDAESHMLLDVQLEQTAMTPLLQYLTESQTDLLQFIITNFPDAARERELGPMTASVPIVLAQAGPVTASNGATVAARPELSLPPKWLPDPIAFHRLSGPPAQWPPVTVVPRSQAELVATIDAILTQHWQDEALEPAPLADDEELLRRVYLDLVGRTPTVYEIRTYLADQSADRYEQRVEQLLNSADHRSHLATVWRTFLIPDGVDLTAFGGVEAFDRWLADRLTQKRSYSQIVDELLQAEGRLSRSGPLLFYSATKLNPDELAARTARVFLGVRLECAQCHDHPFEPWTQQDFWGLAACFAQISRPQTTLQAVSTVMQVRDVNRGEVKLPLVETVVAPQLLDGTSIDDTDKTPSRRAQLAAWITRPDNPYFARATANRIWDLLFGQGLVNPVDDFGTQHPPRSPELLEAMASKLIEDHYQWKNLFQAITLSRAYRLSSAAPTADDRRSMWFAQMPVKALSAEQMYDCITVAALLDNNSDSAFQLNRFDNVPREQFLQEFRTVSGRRTEYQGGIPQALTLMNGTLIANATGLSSSGLLKSLEAPFFTNRQRIEVLYLATLSRRPRDAEWEHLAAFLPEDARGAELQEGLADILWALLNSAEFTLNH